MKHIKLSLRKETVENLDKMLNTGGAGTVVINTIPKTHCYDCLETGGRFTCFDTNCVIELPTLENTRCAESCLLGECRFTAGMETCDCIINF